MLAKIIRLMTHPLPSMEDTASTATLARTSIAADPDDGGRAILSEEAVRQGAVWSLPEVDAESAVWDGLASENEIHAAIAASSEEREREKGRESLEFILRHLEPGMRVLDLGCGYGRLAKYLLPAVALDAYVGIDCSPVMLKKFHERYAASDAERGTPLVLVRGDIDRLPLRDASVDACIVSAVYLHNHKDVTRRSLSEVRRVLRPGGKLLIVSSFPNAAGLPGLQGRAYLAYLGLVGRGAKNGPVRHFSREEIQELLSGFRNVEIVPMGFAVFPKVVLGMPAPLRAPYRRFVDRVHATLAKRFAQSARERNCVHFDVVAEA